MIDQSVSNTRLSQAQFEEKKPEAAKPEREVPPEYFLRRDGFVIIEVNGVAVLLHDPSRVGAAVLR